MSDWPFSQVLFHSGAQVAAASLTFSCRFQCTKIAGEAKTLWRCGTLYYHLVDKKSPGDRIA